MKTIKILSTLAFIAPLFIQTMSAHTFDDSTYLGNNATRATVASSQFINVKLGNTKQKETVTFKIVDDEDNVLVKEKLQTPGVFAKKYDMSHLKDGQYEMVVDGNLNRTRQPFTIKGGKVKMFNNDKTITFFPVFKFQNDNLDVNVLLNNPGNIVVRLFDDESNEILRDKRSREFRMHQRYDMSKLRSGKYFVEVTANDEIFYYDVAK